METHDYGLIYVLTNECMPNLIKIGKTSRHELKKRMAELYSTGVPMPFDCAFAYKVEMDRLADVENGLHMLFDDDRVPSGREFFYTNPKKVEIALRDIGHFLCADDATTEVQKEIDEVVETDDKKTKSPNMDFYKMGLKNGDTLVLSQSKNTEHPIVCTVHSYRQVWFDGKPWSLSRLTQVLIASKYMVRPAPLWETTDGTNLLDLYNKCIVNEAAELQGLHQQVAAAAKNALSL